MDLAEAWAILCKQKLDLAPERFDLGTAQALTAGRGSRHALPAIKAVVAHFLADLAKRHGIVYHRRVNNVTRTQDERPSIRGEWGY